MVTLILVECETRLGLAKHENTPSGKKQAT